MSKEKVLRMLSIFVAVLVIALPFYISDVHAQSLTIVKNSGQGNVEDADGSGYANLRNDIWTLIVRATTGSTVTANEVDVNGLTFSQYQGTCAPSGAGGYGCTYIFDYSTGAMSPEYKYPIVVDLYSTGRAQLLATTSSTLTVDGSAPDVVDLEMRQNQNMVGVTMTVEDQPFDCAGIGRIEVYDGDTDTLLKTLQGSELDNQLDDQCGENDISTSTVFPSAGSISKTGKIKVYDRVGNVVTATDDFVFDYTSPVVFTQTLKLGEFSQYIPSGNAFLDISINISEDCDDCLTAEATSTDWGWLDEPGVCTKVDYDTGMFTCVWANKNIPLDEDVELDLVVSDGANIVNQHVSKSFTYDSTDPVIAFFGAGEHDGKIYVNPGYNVITAIFDERESGMDVDSIEADLHALDPFKGVRFPPDNCTLSGHLWTCYWYNVENVADSSVAKIHLVQAKDMVGNAVDTTAGIATVNAELDDVDPVIPEDEIQIFALGPEGAVSFYQSQDILKIDFVVEEDQGVVAKVDLNDIVNPNEFIGVIHDNGIVEASCTGGNGTYSCTALTPRIKSSDSNAEIEIIVTDTAGNIGRRVYGGIEILGQLSEANPNHWKVKDIGISMSPSGVDTTTTDLVAQRVFVRIPLEKTTPEVSMLGSTFDSCTNDGNLDKGLMVNNMFASTNPYLVLELKTFDSSSIDALRMNCTINIFSELNGDAIINAEKETFEVEIPFYMTEFDSERASLDAKIEKARDRAETGYYKTIGVLTDIIIYAKYGCIAVSIIDSLRQLVDIVTAGLEVLKLTPASDKARAAQCKTMKDATASFEDTALEALDKLCKIVSCELGLVNALQEAFSIKDEDTGKVKHDLDGWWKDHVSTPAQTNYMMATEKDGKKPASARIAEFREEAGVNTDPYSNIIMAVVHLCVPAIIFNLDKLRQIECRYIDCLENDVKNGVTTIDACKDLKRYQTCKYWIGGVFSLIPYVGLVDGIVAKLKGMLKDPVGLLEFVLVYGCNKLCDASSVSAVICSFVYALSTVLDIANDIAAMASQYKTLNADYCSQVGIS
ncbi:MAG: hypothetical protein KAT77_04425 [Nanoarchaeota archaeon]|nr:hypothetical protein [Nanoarchaeota archaeon]